MDNENEVKVITLGDLWQVFLRRLPLILLFAVIAALLAVAADAFLIKPMYKSTATLYILKQENTKDYSYTQSDYTLAMNLVNDCTYMLKSHSVLDEVIEELDLNMSYKDLARVISTRNPENTRILEISVKTANPKTSKTIVDAICASAAKTIERSIGLDQVNIYDEGILETKPCNKLGSLMYIVFGLVGAVLSYIVFLILFMSNDRIKTEEDIKKYLELSVLGVIPCNSKSTEKVDKRKKRKSSQEIYGEKGID